MAGKTLGVAESEPVLDALTVTSNMTVTSSTLAFFGATAAARVTGAVQATTAATWATVCATRAAFATSDDATTFFNMVKNIQHVLKTTGLWKGSA